MFCDVKCTCLRIGDEIGLIEAFRRCLWSAAALCGSDDECLLRVIDLLCVIRMGGRLEGRLTNSLDLIS